MKTFYFNTGVRPYNHTPPVPIMPGKIIRGGTLQIPFDCENVPDNSVFMFACDDENIKEYKAANIIVRNIHNSSMVSKFAYFRLPVAKE